MSTAMHGRDETAIPLPALASLACGAALIALGAAMADDKAGLLHGVKHLLQKAGWDAPPPCDCPGLDRDVTVM